MPLEAAEPAPISPPIAAAKSEKTATATKRRWTAANLVLLALIAVLAFLVMGYHPGLEDDAFYLAAIKKNLNPALFPHDTDFFRVQFQATAFDKVIAWSVRLTHLHLAWATLLWQFAAIFFLLYFCWRISRRCFSSVAAQWAAVAMIAAVLTIPVGGTDINLADQYLHPRNLATAIILAAVSFVVERRYVRASIALAVAFVIHAIMASFGISLCAFLLFSQYGSQNGDRRRTFPAPSILPAGALLMPMGWMFEPASAAWRVAASTRSFYSLMNWHWYEWLGVFAPLALFAVLRRFLRTRKEFEPESSNLLWLTSAVFCYGAFQNVVGLAIMLPPGLERLRPFEPMRYMQLIYLFFFLVLGGLLGQYFLKRHYYRWALLFIPLGAGMFYAQRQMYPASAHLELPGMNTQNSWLEAFTWIRHNTPVNSQFALDPRYIELPGEDCHGFRALAERSVLADYVKDGGMAARVPRLAPRWLREVTAQQGWRNFQLADFERLQHDFGVDWIIVSRKDRIASELSNKDFSDQAVSNTTSSQMTCPYQNAQLLVCRYGENAAIVAQR